MSDLHDDMLPELAFQPVGRRMCLYGGGKSKSKSTTTTTTINNDRRMVVGDGAAGISNESGVVTVNMLDGGAVANALAVVDRSNALQRQSLDDVLGLAGDVFARGADIVQRSQEQTGAAYDILLNAKNDAETTASGKLDQKTVVVLAVAAAGVAMVALRGRA